MDELWVDKTVLITGGTGTLGNALLQHLIRTSAKKLIVFSRDERKQHDMAGQYTDGRIRFFIGDVRDRDRLRRAFGGVDYVIHAAALKHVPTLEYNPLEAVQTNIYGSSNVIEAAIDAGVEKVVAISTDKAVNPVNLYGATKLVMEKTFTAANDYAGHKARFACVRYGNVVGSRGSVIEVFGKLREQGIHLYPVTVPEMTRFWITTEQAVCLIEFALREARGGEIYVPRLPSMRMSELVKAVDSQGVMSIVGIRPGEKMHESLVSEDIRNVWMVDLTLMEARPAAGPYASDRNTDWLTMDEMKGLIDGTPTLATLHGANCQTQ